LKGTTHGMESNSLFGSAFFPGQISFSQEQVIGKVKVVIRSESIEVFQQFFVLFGFDSKSVPVVVFFSFKHGF